MLDAAFLASIRARRKALVELNNQPNRKHRKIKNKMARASRRKNRRG